MKYDSSKGLARIVSKSKPFTAMMSCSVSRRGLGRSKFWRRVHPDSKKSWTASPWCLSTESAHPAYVPSSSEPPSKRNHKKWHDNIKCINFFIYLAPSFTSHRHLSSNVCNKSKLNCSSLIRIFKHLCAVLRSIPQNARFETALVFDNDLSIMNRGCSFPGNAGHILLQ